MNATEVPQERVHVITSSRTQTDLQPMGTNRGSDPAYSGEVGLMAIVLLQAIPGPNQFGCFPGRGAALQPREAPDEPLFDLGSARRCDSAIA
jgi:hypothetical protein